MTAVFPYLEGKTRAELLGEILTAQGADAEVSAIRAAMDEIYNIRPEERKPFAVTPEFIKVFNALGELDSYRDKETENGGGWASLGAVLADESYSASNIDALFENMLVTADGTYAIDYEWVFLFPVPGWLCEIQDTGLFLRPL